LQSGVWAMAGGDNAQTATSTAKSLISTSSVTYETNHEMPGASAQVAIV
jgi:hypothetical protein